MALFGRKKKEETAPVPAPMQKAAAALPLLPGNPGAVLLRPRLTEKGAVLSERGVYAFTVHPDATKKAVSEAVFSIFKVKPVAVRFIRIVRKEKTTRQTGRKGMTRGGKKAYVTLKEGDKIELV